MKIKPKNKLSKSSKILLIVSAAILATAGGVVSYLYFSQIGPFAPRAQGVNYGPATTEEINAGKDIKEQNSKPDTSANTGTGNDNTSTTVPGNNSKSTVAVEITAAQNGNTINIRTIIQTLSSNGSCTLHITGPAGRTYTASSKTQLGPSTSTCMGFDVSTTSLSPGAWTATINYEDNVAQGSATKDITVQ